MKVDKSIFEYLKPNADQQETMGVLRTNFAIVANVVDQLVPDGRYKSLAMTALEEAAMWANKGVTRCNNGAPREGAEIIAVDDLKLLSRCDNESFHASHDWHDKSRDLPAYCPGFSHEADADNPQQGAPLPARHGALNLTAGAAALGATPPV
jgi:hypothetical protein